MTHIDSNTMDDRPFWRTKPLEEMSRAEWESLCDGCARCCLLKLEDVDTGEIHYTSIACHLLNEDTCRCTDYANRAAVVPTCLALEPEMVRSTGWLPATCAYRLVAEGRDLYWWHPLVSGDPHSVESAGISVRGRTVSESAVAEDDFEDYLADWPASDPESGAE